MIRGLLKIKQPLQSSHKTQNTFLITTMADSTPQQNMVTVHDQEM